MKDEIMKDRLHIGEAVDKEDKLVDLLSMNQSMMTMIPVNARVDSLDYYGLETIVYFRIRRRVGAR